MDRSRLRRPNSYIIAKISADVIISLSHKSIFFAVPKTGTQSIRQALTPHLGEGDWQQHALLGRAWLPIPELAASGHGHLSVCDVAPLLPSEIWNTYFKFAFVRNPFERFVSAYVFLFRKSFAADHAPERITTDMKSALGRTKFRQRILIAPQCQFLEDSEGTLALDFVGRFECLEADFEAVCRKPASKVHFRGPIQAITRTFPSIAMTNFTLWLQRSMRGTYSDSATVFRRRDPRRMPNASLGANPIKLLKGGIAFRHMTFHQFTRQDAQAIKGDGKIVQLFNRHIDVR